MNFLDIGIFLILFYNMFNGLRKGFIRSVFEIVALVGSIILALVYYAPVAEGASKLLGVHFTYSSVISFIVLWLFGFFIILLIGRFVESFFTISIFNWLNVLGGIVFGFCKGFIILLPFILPMLYFNFPFAKDSFLLNSMKPAFALIINNYLPKPLFELNRGLSFSMPSNIIPTKNVELLIPKPKKEIVTEKVEKETKIEKKSIITKKPKSEKQITPKKNVSKKIHETVAKPKKIVKPTKNIKREKEIESSINKIKHKQKSRIMVRKQKESELRKLLKEHKITLKKYRAEIKKLRAN